MPQRIFSTTWLKTACEYNGQDLPKKKVHGTCDFLRACLYFEPLVKFYPSK